MNIDLRDVYQLLLCEGRYAYTRNNHLMPSTFYDRVKRLVPEMIKEDKLYGVDTFGVATLKQLVKECIQDEILTRFADGEDDEFGNRKASIEFINSSLDYIHAIENNNSKDWFPYNYDDFLANLEKDDEPRYNIYQVDKFNGDNIILTTRPVSQKEYMEYILDQSKLVIYDTSQITYNKEKVNDKTTIYHIQDPIQVDFIVEHI